MNSKEAVSSLFFLCEIEIFFKQIRSILFTSQRFNMSQNDKKNGAGEMPGSI